MDGYLSNVTGLAVWGSLAATLILGAFFFVQAFVDRPRRVPFALFTLVMMYLGALDLSRSLTGLNVLSYEWLRLWWGGAYAGCALWLVGESGRTAAGATIAIWLIGFTTFHFGNPVYATTLAFPFAFGATSVAFIRKYRASRGYASAILAAYSAAMALTCSVYISIVARGVQSAILLGYFHYAFMSVVTVLLGWTHLARELQGRSPVRTPWTLAAGHFAAVLLSEGLVAIGLLRGEALVPPLFLAGGLLQFGVTLALYLHRRHQLVIHADNVGQLLEARTAELTQAREELARQNDVQALKLREQERDLRAKGEVIDRQRRLELAAQTAGQVAHDIQNLLSPNLGKIGEFEEVHSLDEIRDISGSIRRQIRQLLEVNTNLLALSRRGRSEAQAVNLGELARDVAEKFPGQRITLDPVEEAWVSGSWAQLVRAASNLVTNALESDPDRLVPVTCRTGVLVVEQSRRCHLGFLGAGRYSFLEVQDGGPGIPPEHLDKIFEPFFSSKDSRKQRSGTGLGLTIVGAVADDHKGVIDLETGPGGTRFTMYFPAHAPSVDPADLSRLSCKATVLVVDDDRSVLAEYVPALREAAWTVIQAEGGPQAIKLLQAYDVDVVLLDFNMPRMDGLQTFFGAMHVRPGLRAVIHSSYLTEDQGAKLRAMGVSTILLKPAGRLAVLRALKEAYEEKARSQTCREQPGS